MEPFGDELRAEWDRSQRTEIRAEKEASEASGSTAIDIAPVPDAEKVDRVLVDIDDVNNAVVAHSKPTAVGPFQAMMRESVQTSAHLVDSGFDSCAEIGRKLEKRSDEAGVENLEGAHQPLNLSCSRTDTLRFFLLGLFEGGLEFGGELKIVLQKVIEQNAKLRELSLRKLVQLGFDLFDLAHVSNCRLPAVSFKPDCKRRVEWGEDPWHLRYPRLIVGMQGIRRSETAATKGGTSGLRNLQI